MTKMTPSGRLLSAEEIAKIRPTTEQYEAINKAEEVYEPACFKGLFWNDEVLKATKLNIAQAQDIKSTALAKAEIAELKDALDGILGYAEEYHTAFDGETGKTRDWYLQAVSHAQEVSKKYSQVK